MMRYFIWNLYTESLYGTKGLDKDLQRCTHKILDKVNLFVLCLRLQKNNICVI